MPSTRSAGADNRGVPLLTPTQRRFMPPRVLPWLYFGVGYASLALAFAAIAVDPRAAAGFFYHAHLAGIVHLVTLGWLSASILGALYVVGPLALRTPMPARWTDAAAFAAFVIGLAGMVTHFWIEEFSGMAWSGLMVALAILQVGARTLRGLRRAPVHGAVKLHVQLAFLNIGLAATMGVLLGFDKAYHFLPGFVISNVVAHAHLAAIGWASMMVVGIGYRLLPMVLPARPPRGPGMYASAILLEAAAVGIFVTLVLRSAWTAVFAAAALAGFIVFGAHVAAMIKHKRPRPPGLPAVEYAARHAWLALASLAVTLAIGIVLATVEPSALTMQAALAYGVFGLVGFLAQMVAGMQVRLLPLLAWYTAAHRTPVEALAPMHGATTTRMEDAAWLLWLWGVPALAAGFFFTAIPLLTAGAVALEIAVAIGAVRGARLAARAFGSSRRLSSTPRGTEHRRAPAPQPAVPAARP